MDQECLAGGCFLREFEYWVGSEISNWVYLRHSCVACVQRAIAGQEARNKDVHMVLDEVERVVESLETATEKLEDTLNLQLRK